MRSDAPALLPIFRSRHQAEMLALLLLHPGREYSVSDLAQRLNVPLSTLHREIVRLDTAGLVVSRAQGRNRMVRANLDNRAAAPLAQLLGVTFGPMSVVGEQFASLGAELVMIFGSWAARYEGVAGPPPHDIDVLVVGAVDRADAYEAADRAQALLGMEVNPVVRSIAQWDAGADALTAQIKASPYVIVGGARTTESRR